jgi:hypothetical protein
MQTPPTTARFSTIATRLELGRVNRGAVSGRTRTNDQQVVVVIVVSHSGAVWGRVHAISSTARDRRLRITTAIEPLFSSIAAWTSCGELHPARSVRGASAWRS